MTIGERIQTIRQRRGMTQEELAQAMGYKTNSTITKIEKGINCPPLSKLKKLAQALSVDVMEIIGEEQEQPATQPVFPLAQRLKALRLERGMTQEEVADKLYTSPEAISNYERGERIPKADMLERYADALGCNVGTLLGISPKPKMMTPEERWKQWEQEGMQRLNFRLIEALNATLIFKELQTTPQTVTTVELQYAKDLCDHIIEWFELAKFGIEDFLEKGMDAKWIRR